MLEKKYPSFSNSPRVQKIARLAKEYKGTASSYLDIGCGDGSIAAHLGKILGSQEVIGVEIEQESLDRAVKAGRITRGFCLDIGVSSFEKRKCRG